MIDLLNDFEGAAVPVAASIHIMDLAGRLKDIPYSKAGEKGRALSTGDAIMLATCLLIPDVYGVTIDAFHTYDDGRKPRVIPLLSYHEWCEGLTGEAAALADRVKALKRERPHYPQARLSFQKE